jgi:hypothetical protein
MRKFDIRLWSLSVFTLCLANFLWTLHDWYFWDPKTHEFVEIVFKNWHYLKLLWIALFIVSVYCVPFRLTTIIGWLLIRWFTWEAFCSFASISQPYNPGFVFGIADEVLAAELAITTAFLVILIEIILGRKKK